MIIGVFLIDLIELNIILKDSGGHQKCFLPQICIHMFTLFMNIFFGVFCSQIRIHFLCILI